MASRFYRKRTPTKLKKLDQSVIKIVEGLNELILQAESDDLAPLSSILTDARESIAWWATYDDYNETHSDALAHRLKFSSGLNIAAVLLAKFAALEDSELRKDLLEMVRA